MPPKGRKRVSKEETKEQGKSEIHTEESHKESSPVIQHVVEVVDDEATNEVLTTIKHDAQEIEKAAETLEDTIDTIESKSEESQQQPKDIIEESLDGEPKDITSEKASVEDIFSPELSDAAPEISMSSRQRKIPLGIWAGLMIGMALAIGSVLLMWQKGGSFGSSLSFMATPTATPTLAPTKPPTPTPMTIKRSEVHVVVINGGGVAGAGSKMKKKLEALGYVVDSVSNAKEYTYEKTEVSVKAGQEAIAVLLKSDLTDEYSLVEKTAELAASKTYDALVTVGK